MSTPKTKIAIIGTGFAGLGMAIRLKQQGIDDFVLLERASDVGGTWRDNTYPGAQCDVPSHLYSFSFAPNPNWSRTFSRQPEIHAYLRDCADRYGIRPHIRFDTELVAAGWNDDERRWELETSDGDLHAQMLVAGMGPLSEPSVPDIPGLDSFEGNAFHSARWDHDYDLTGKRVAVVGTGASAIQFVPKIQPDVAELHLFQRTPPWVLPHTDRPLKPLERTLYKLVPAAQKLVREGIYWGREIYALGLTRRRELLNIPRRLALRHLNRQVEDPDLRARLTPDYEIGCKRILISNRYYPALTKPNVDVVSGGVTEVRGSTVVASDRTEREVDAIIFGTGFQVTDMPAASVLRGKDGELLEDHWQGSPQAYLGAAISGFPNFFMLIGPNTGLGHSSMVYMIESQISYVLDCLRALDEEQADTVEVRAEVQRAYNEEVQANMDGTVWTAGGCASWYLDREGRNTTLWPDFTWRFRRRTERFDRAAYMFSSARRREPVPA